MFKIILKRILNKALSRGDLIRVRIREQVMLGTNALHNLDRWRCLQRGKISVWNLKYKINILFLVPLFTGGDLARRGDCLWAKWGRGYPNGYTHWFIIKNTLSLHSNGVFYLINGYTHWDSLKYQQKKGGGYNWWLGSLSNNKWKQRPAQCTHNYCPRVPSEEFPIKK